jgi:hypothetical protein
MKAEGISPAVHRRGCLAGEFTRRVPVDLSNGGQVRRLIFPILKARNFAVKRKI